MMAEHHARLVVAAPHGRSGKTTVSLGLAAGLAAQGLAVQPFKKGPDYIDPSWLSVAAGRPCRNLDVFMMGRGGVQRAFAHGARGADLALVEGAMGLYDGLDAAGTGSTAEVAKALAAPVVLVVDATRMTRSVAALVSGFQRFDSGVSIAGVILNRVANPRHEAMLRGAIAGYCGLPVLGVVAKDRGGYEIPDRHLGLIPAGEDQGLARRVRASLAAIAGRCDLDAILALARSAPALVAPDGVSGRAGAGFGLDAPASGGGAKRPRIGVFRDRAFSFYYPENLEALTAAGADLVPVDALADADLPSIDALYLGGGFPEVHGDGLSANVSLRAAVRRAVRGGLPVYAECGGLMYLGKAIVWRGRSYPMSGALPFEVEMVEAPAGHGYVEAAVCGPNPFFRPGLVVRGHEFHHSRVINLEEDRVGVCFRLARGSGIGGGRDGIVFGNALAAYTHLHAFGVPEWAGALVRAARGDGDPWPGAG